MARSSFCSMWVCGVFVGMEAIVAFPTFISAQVVADPSIGTIVTPNGTTFQIIGGTTAGNRNLFHSFSRFDVPTDDVADFLNNSNIINIFSRVTGGTPSQIDGIVRSAGTANLFLMNPNGIIFGQNAQLNVGGSFVATTANAIQFGDRGFFSATNPEAPSSLLTIDPSAFLFNQLNAATIENRSIAPAANGLAGFFNLRGLEVAEGRSIVLLGSNVIVNGGGVIALGGRVELAGLAQAGTVGLEVDNETLRLNLPDNVARADVALVNGAGVTAAGQGGGDVTIYARNIDVLQGSFIEAGIIPYLVANKPSGDIVLNATESTTIDDSFVYNGVFSGATGNAGKINIVTGSLSLTNGGQLSANVFPGSKGNSEVITITARDKVSILGGGKIISSVLDFGKGNAGRVNITANGAVLLDGEERNFSATTFFPSAIFSRVEKNGEGNAGNVTIRANSLSVANRAQIASTTAGQGNAGNIALNIDEQTFLLNSLILSEVSEESGNGTGGDIKLTTGSLILRNGAGLLADTENRGNAGNVFITARGDVVLDGTGPSAADRNQIVPSQISTSVESGAIGQGGKIEITARSLSILDRGFISSSTAGRGNAGNVTLNIDKQTLLLNSLIISEVTEGSGIGNGGNISITTDSLILKNGSALLADAENQGNAGNISIVARGDVVLNGIGPSASDRNQIVSSQISTTVESAAIGQGGKIEITASSLSVLDGGFISSTTFGQGDANDIRIQTDTLTLRDGAQLSSRTEGASNAGNIFAVANDSVTISGIDADGFRSGLLATTGTASKGNAGNITLESNSFLLSNQAIIASSSRGRGDAGDITIRARNRFNLTNSDITTSASAASGGSINVTAGKVRLTGDSDISSSVASGLNGGGNIRIAADYILALDDSDIFAFSRDGQGGNITLSRAFFGVGFQLSSLEANPQTLQGNDRPDINATGQVSSGTVTTPDNSFIQNGLTELSQNLIDPNTLLANSCIVRNRDHNGSFKITGSGGLPYRPGDAPIAPFPTGEVRSLPNTQSQSDRPWQLGDAIVEPQGIYRLSNGKLVMSRECEP